MADRYCEGPSIGGIARKVEAYPPPPGIRPRDRVAFDSLALQRAELATKSVALLGDTEKEAERAALGAQLKMIEASMNALRMAEEEIRPQLAPLTASIVRVGRSNVLPSQKKEGALGAAVTSSAVLTQQRAQERKKKKKKKRKTGKAEESGTSSSTATKTSAVEGGKVGGKPTPSRNQPDPGRRLQRPTTERAKAPGPTKSEPPPTSTKEGEIWSRVVGRRAQYEGKTRGGQRARRVPLG